MAILLLTFEQRIPTTTTTTTTTFARLSLYLGVQQVGAFQPISIRINNYYTSSNPYNYSPSSRRTTPLYYTKQQKLVLSSTSFSTYSSRLKEKQQHQHHQQQQQRVINNNRNQFWFLSLVIRKTTIIGMSQFSSLDENYETTTSATDVEPTTENDVQRWEQMYYQSETNNKNNNDNDIVIDIMDDDENDMTRSNREKYVPVKVITFDLDNTLWKTDITIQDANDALYDYLRKQYQLQERIENYMKILFQSDPMRYCPNYNKNDIPGNRNDPSSTKNKPQPVLLTLLRKDAIRYAINESVQNNETTMDTTTIIDQVVDDAFGIWMQQRLVSIQNNLASNVIATLQSLRKSPSSCNNDDASSSSSSSNNNNKVLIGAITDGNSNPLQMQFLEGLFDFCVNAEMVGVTKPDKRVYLHAAQQYILPLLQRQQHEVNDDTNDLQNIQRIESAIGPWWVHVGDDFVKDIVAAKSLNIRTIWCRELVGGNNKDTSSTKRNVNDNNSNIKDNDDDDDDTDIQEFVQKVASSGNKLIMQVGSDDYLSNSIQSEFCDAIIDQFSDITKVIEQWSYEVSVDICAPAIQPSTLSSLSSSSPTVSSDPNKNNIIATTNNATFSVSSVGSDIKSAPNVYSKSPPTTVTDPVVPQPEQKTTIAVPEQQPSTTIATKFCIHCGEKLPAIAKFCSACGGKQ